MADSWFSVPEPVFRFTFGDIPRVSLDGVATACLDCGTVVAQASPPHLQKTAARWMSDEAKKQSLGLEGRAKKITGVDAGGPRQLPRSPSEPPEAQTAPKRTNVGRAFEGACLLLMAAGWLAGQAGWMRFESSRIFPILLVGWVGAMVLEGVIDRRLKTEEKGRTLKGVLLRSAPGRV